VRASEPPASRLGAPDAVVFDFDGLILDTEMPVFRSTVAALEALGHELTIGHWSSVIGLGDAESFPALCAALGADLDQDEFDAAYGRQDRSWRESLPPEPGVVDLLDALASEGIPCGIASSSSSRWVEGHLDRLGLLDRFGVVATEDRVGGRTKPAPDSYLHACRTLGVEPARAVAIEDSAHGVTAARAAGLAVLAVPTVLTEQGDFSAADRIVPSLVGITVPDLAALVGAG